MCETIFVLLFVWSGARRAYLKTSRAERALMQHGKVACEERKTRVVLVPRKFLKVMPSRTSEMPLFKCNGADLGQ